MAQTASAPTPIEPLMIDVRQVAALLGCSTRHVYRLADLKEMPQPARLGALVRWHKQAIREWIDGGCRKPA
jgi:excisionase family DNA binding protein